LQDFLKTNSINGTSHHWAVVNGNVKEELSLLADMLGIKSVVFLIIYFDYYPSV